ncbi:MAG TPA: hypothetical protein PKK96_08075 [Anaerolineales bacterium]|nr:hypothetical protein [Anaerolineales bacterium]HNQ93532.1 hypothetical protein [Anaerolineales bacterium]HNS60946.1 hypothetical protein [Anaerolineales bacterium]
MNNNSPLKWLVPAIILLTLLATLAGLLPGDGQPFPLTNFRGEQVTINARGLYYWDTVSSAAQMQANDLVTLALGLPLLAISFWLSLRGSLRGRLLMTGTLGFILYTYITMCFGAAYNKLFLIYVALFSLSLFAFILSMTSFDLKTLPSHFSDKLPRGWIAGLLFFAAAFLSLAWLGRIAATFAPNSIPVLENTTSMFIQAMDLGLIVPLCVMSGVLLLRRRAWGYLLASIGLMKFLTMGVAVSMMSLNMLRVGVAISMVEVSVFPIIAVANLVMVVVLLRNIKDPAYELFRTAKFTLRS